MPIKICIFGADLEDDIFSSELHKMELGIYAHSSITGSVSAVVSVPALAVITSC